MFNPTRDEVRRFFIGAWRKFRSGAELEGLEKVAVGILALHAEYHPLLDAGDAAIGREYGPDSGELNPFLHLSLHLAVAEQVSIDQPRGIRDLHAQLQASRGEHEAAHAVLECLGETVWQAQRTGAPPDEAAYLECIRRSAG
jgi:hypothetical protein